ncbi:MAG TPA: hypothetical protein VN673_04340 [Clostridia bacterium]|nr:hypothetical protein [Clostridia bacterium]
MCFGFLLQLNFQTRSKATNQWLTVESVTTALAGTYSVVVSNSQGILTTNVSVTVLPPAAPFFADEPDSASVYSGVYPGGTPFLSAWVKGSPPFYFQWLKDDLAIPGSESSGSYSGWTYLSFTNIKQADSGNYRLLVTNAWGSVLSSNAYLTVSPPVLPSVIRQPRSLEVAAGVNTRLSIQTTGAPLPFITWKRAGDPPPVQPPGPPMPGAPGPGGTFPGASTKSFYGVSTNNAGVYFAAITNLAGGLLSREVMLNVLPPMTQKGSWGQGAEDVLVTNGLAFVAQGSEGLAILNVSNPATPTLLNKFDTPGYASALHLEDGLAFLADGGSGLQILNISNPAAPSLTGSFDTPGYASDVVVRSNVAYVADSGGGLLILDVSNPATPVLLGSYSSNIRGIGLCLSGQRAFVTSPVRDVLPGTNVTGTMIIDISDPAHPVETARFGTGYYSLSPQGSLLFGANGSGLDVLAQVATPTNPVSLEVVGRFDHYPTTNALQFSRIPVYDVQAVNHLAYRAIPTAPHKSTFWMCVTPRTRFRSAILLSPVKPPPSTCKATSSLSPAGTGN